MERFGAGLEPELGAEDLAERIQKEYADVVK